jgi:hypothetical protein
VYGTVQVDLVCVWHRSGRYQWVYGTVQIAFMGVWHRSGISHGCMAPPRILQGHNSGSRVTRRVAVFGTDLVALMGNTVIQLCLVM